MPRCGEAVGNRLSLGEYLEWRTGRGTGGLTNSWSPWHDMILPAMILSKSALGGSMEVVGEGGGLEGFVAEGEDAVGEEAGGAFGVLELAVDLQEGFLGDDEAVAFEEGGGDEDVGDAGFIFEADEAVAFGCAGALAADDHADDSEAAAMGEGAELAGGGGLGEVVADEADGVGADGEGGGGVVGLEALGGGHGGEGLRWGFGRCGG